MPRRARGAAPIDCRAQTVSLRSYCHEKAKSDAFILKPPYLSAIRVSQQKGRSAKMFFCSYEPQSFLCGVNDELCKMLFDLCYLDLFAIRPGRMYVATSSVKRHEFVSRLCSSVYAHFKGVSSHHAA
jgi:hypothetical protein